MKETVSALKAQLSERWEETPTGLGNTGRTWEDTAQAKQVASKAAWRTGSPSFQGIRLINKHLFRDSVH